MKKYPFSKKALSMMLATALVVTPLAATAPIGGGVAQAQQNEILQLAEDLELFYKHTTESDFAVAQANINSQINIPVPQGLTQPKKDAYEAILKNITQIVYQKHDATSLAGAVNTFKSNQSANFNTLFGDDVTAQHLIDFAKAMKTRFDSNPITYVQGDYNAALLKLVRDTRDNNEDFKTLNSNIKTHLDGHGLEELFQDQSVINNSVDGNRVARNAMVASAFTETATFNLSGTQPVGSSLEFVLTVSYQLSGGMSGRLDLATAVDWYVNGSKIEGNTHTFSTAGTYPVVAKLKDRDTTIFKTNLVVGSSGSPSPTPTPTPEPEPTPETPTVPERPGSTTDANDSITVEREQSSTGQTIAVARVDAERLAEIVAANPTTDRIGFVLERMPGEIAELRLPRAAVSALLNADNASLIVDVDSPDGSVSVPVSELSEETLRAALELNANDDFEVAISIAPVTEEEAAAITETLEEDARGLQPRSDIVDFSITVRSGDRVASLSNFSSYIYREIPVANTEVAASALNNPEFTVVYNVSGEVPVAVPTIAGNDRVRFASFTLDRYVVVEREPVAFPDLRSNFWAKPEIDRLSVRDIFQGREDGTVAPGAPVTRIQLAVLLSRALALTTEAEYEGQFPDIEGGEWFIDELQPIIEAGIVRGRDDGTFTINQPVTRQQAAAMISRAMEHISFNEAKLDSEASIEIYPDLNRIGGWAQEDVQRLLQAGIMEGRDNGNFEPTESMTRAQMAAVLDRLLRFQDLMN